LSTNLRRKITLSERDGDRVALLLIEGLAKQRRHKGNNTIIGEEEVVRRDEFPLGFKGLIVFTQLCEANHLRKILRDSRDEA